MLSHQNTYIPLCQQTYTHTSHWTTKHHLIGCIVEPDKRWPRVNVIPFNIYMIIEIIWYQTWFFKTISVISLCICHRRWYIQFSGYSRVKHDWMYPYVSYLPYILSPLLISWGSICCIHYYYLGWSLLIYYGSDVPRSLGTPPPYWPCRIS